MTPYPRSTCPHCGRAVTNNRFEYHTRICLAQPSVFAATRQALDDGTGQIVSDAAYTGSGERPGQKALIELYGNWSNVAAAFGLRPRPSGGRPLKVAAPAPPDVDDPPVKRRFQRSDGAWLVLSIQEDDRWAGYVRCLLR